MNLNDLIRIIIVNFRLDQQTVYRVFNIRRGTASSLIVLVDIYPLTFGVKVITCSEILFRVVV